MELRHQKYFIAIAEELHFGRAAARLHISQPALSKQIRALEAELGAQLLWRTKREVRLSPAGLTFLRHSREVLRQVDRSIAETHSVGRGDLGSLVLGYLSGASPRIVPKVVRALRKRHPGVEVRLRLLLPPNSLSEVRNSQVDFLFSGFPIDAPDLVVEKIVEEPLTLALPKGHPLAARKRIPFSSLEGIPVVIWPRSLAPDQYDNLILYFRNAKARFNPALETFPMDTLVTAVASGIGVAFVPDCARDHPQRGVEYRNLVPPRPSVAWSVLYRRQTLGGVQEAFLKVVREVFQIPAKG